MAKARIARFDYSGGTECPHCGADIWSEDFCEFGETLPQRIPVDSDGFNRTWVANGLYQEPCASCGAPLVLGADVEGELFVVAGRSRTDLKYLQLIEGGRLRDGT